ncbi:MAG: ribonuclease III [Dethiobacteria bacterium]|jgi:ribonuclease-3|nr:ribonuclease III [Bacillota bacterium]HOP68773.1 ribonuclease III [Bacillota bacterium]HPT33860.1 ribonuclease III [Bacillota bacterium]HPZ64579.1 ribonuclease III [Bacillota bacterium]HQD06986.1 ribonuclease III [Bacillota bacterium]
MWSEKVRQLLQRLQWDYRNLQLYEQALTHSSYAHEKCRHLGYNERLEFLGDAVLELVISDYLYHSYPHLSEGKLTKLRSDLVCEASLARLAYSLDLGRYLRLGKGEMAGGGSSRPSLLADAVEALIGALYLDLGLEKCRYCVLALFQPIFQELKEGTLRRDYKTLVQEYAQARFSSTPEYRIVRESGPDHDKIFEAEILIQKQPAGRGIGRSKKDAEQAAAREAWFKLVR